MNYETFSNLKPDDTVWNCEMGYNYLAVVIGHGKDHDPDNGQIQYEVIGTVDGKAFSRQTWSASEKGWGYVKFYSDPQYIGSWPMEDIHERTGYGTTISKMKELADEERIAIRRSQEG